MQSEHARPFRLYFKFPDSLALARDGGADVGSKSTMTTLIKLTC